MVLKKSIWLYGLNLEWFYPFFTCMTLDYEIAVEVENVSTRGDEVTLNAEKYCVLWRSPDFPGSTYGFVSFYG